MSLSIYPDEMIVSRSFENDIQLGRAKRTWASALLNHFLLQPERDYRLTIQRSLESSLFVLRVEFHSACGRFAFWRLVNQQAPEVEAKLTA